MSTDNYRPDGRASSPITLLLVLFLAVFCLNLLIPRDLWVQDEARYGEVLREMLSGSSWLVPHLNGHPYPDKPPLYFWVVAAVGALVGPGELAFRLVTLLSTLAAMFGVYRLGRDLLGPREGLWASAIFATSLLTLVVGQIVRMDMLLTAATVFAWYALHRYRSAGVRGALVGFWALTTLGVAIKGPVALLFTLAPGVVWLLWIDGWRGLRSLHVLPGLLGLAGVAGLWMLMVIVQGQGQYLVTIWQEQLVGRAIDSWSHKEPVYFYLVLAPLLFMPWTGVVVRGTHALLDQKITGWQAITSFCVVPLLGISLVSGKLFIYMEPLMPAVALAAAVAAVPLAGSATVSRWLSWPPVLFVLALGAGVIRYAQPYLQARTSYGYAVGAALIMVAVLGLVLARGSGRHWLFGWAGLSAALSLLLFGAMTSLLNPLFSARPLGELLAAQPAGVPIGVVNTTRGILNYYAGRTLQELGTDEASTWWRAHPDGILIFKSTGSQAIFGAQGIPHDCRIRQTYSIELKEYHVLAGC